MMLLQQVFIGIFFLIHGYIKSPTDTERMTKAFNNFDFHMSADNRVIYGPSKKEVDFTTFRKNIVSHYNYIWSCKTGFSFCLVHPSDPALTLLSFKSYTFNVKLETLPSKISAIVQRRREYMKAFFDEESATVGQAEQVAQYVNNKHKEPLWSAWEYYYMYKKTS